MQSVLQWPQREEHEVAERFVEENAWLPDEANKGWIMRFQCQRQHFQRRVLFPFQYHRSRHMLCVSSFDTTVIEDHDGGNL